MKELSRTIGEMEFDGLISGITPPVQVAGGIIAALTTETTYKRGTVLAKSAKTGKLYIMGTEATDSDTLTPDSILCDDTVVGTADVSTAVYTAGCINTNKVYCLEGYTIKEADKDNLRMRGIILKATMN